MDMYLQDTVQTLTTKLLHTARFPNYEALKGAVNAYSSKVGYGSKIVPADGTTRAEFVCLVSTDCTFNIRASARSKKELGIFRVNKKSCITHSCDQLLHMGQTVQPDKYAVARMLVPQVTSQGTVPDAGSVQTIAAETLDMPVKKATAYRAMALAKATVFGEYNEEFTYIEPYLEQFVAQNPGSKMYVNFDANGHK